MAILKQTLSTSYSVATPPLVLQQVDGTSCFSIKVDIFTAAAISTLDVFTTAGSLSALGYRDVFLDEVLSFTNSDAASLDKPGVQSIVGFSVIGGVYDSNGRAIGTPKFVFDGTANVVRVSNGQAVFAVLRIQYTARARRYAFAWPDDGSVSHAIIGVISDTGVKESLTVDFADCFSDEEKNEDALDQYPMELNCFATVPNIAADAVFAQGPGGGVFTTDKGFQARALVHAYPFPDNISPDFTLSVGTSQVVIPTWDTERKNPAHPISEFVQFSNSATANISSLPATHSAVRITEASALYNTKGRRENFIRFAQPGARVRDQAGGYFTLGPTQIAAMDAFDKAVAINGMVKVEYHVVLRTVVFKFSLPLDAKLFEQWDVTLFCSAMVDTQVGAVGARHALLSGSTNVPNPYDNAVASDRNENELMQKYFPTAPV